MKAAKPRPSSLSERCYRLLLHFYPRSHRREYGEWMLQAFRASAQQARHERGLFGVFALWGMIFSDFFTTVLWEHLDAYEKDHSMKKIIIQESLRALSLGWLALILLGLVYRNLGMTSGQVLGGALLVGLLAFLGFTLARWRTGSALQMQSRRSWLVLCGLIALSLLGYVVGNILAGNTALLEERLFPILVGFFLILLSAWWGLKHFPQTE